MLHTLNRVDDKWTYHCVDVCPRVTAVSAARMQTAMPSITGKLHRLSHKKTPRLLLKVYIPVFLETLYVLVNFVNPLTCYFIEVR